MEIFKFFAEVKGLQWKKEVQIWTKFHNLSTLQFVAFVDLSSQKHLGLSYVHSSKI